MVTKSVLRQLFHFILIRAATYNALVQVQGAVAKWLLFFYSTLSFFYHSVMSLCSDVEIGSARDLVPMVINANSFTGHTHHHRNIKGNFFLCTNVCSFNYSIDLLAEI